MHKKTVVPLGANRLAQVIHARPMPECLRRALRSVLLNQQSYW